MEKEAELGGNLRHIYYTLEGNDVQALLQQTVQEVLGNPRIQVFTNAEVKSIQRLYRKFQHPHLGQRNRERVSSTEW